MPKKDKKRSERKGRLEPADGDDASSVNSDQTISTCGDDENDSVTSQNDNFEEKFKDAMDLATNKAAKVRTNALISLKTALQKRLLTEFLLDHFLTLTDTIERSLKKGKDGEQVAAAKLSSTLIITMLGTIAEEQIYNLLRPCLSSLVTNEAQSLPVREAAVSALAFLAFLACPDSADLPITLNTLQNVFRAAQPKGNGEFPNHSAARTAMHVAALQGICLLLSLLSPTTVYTMAPKMIQEWHSMLASPDVELRVTVGEGIALLYESSRLHDEDFCFKDHKQLLVDLEEMVTESSKFRAKRDKKTQRVSFRDIVQTVKDSEEFSEVISVGPSCLKQELVLSSWSLRFQYSAFCQCIDNGLDYHMTYNEPVRAIFDLGKAPTEADLKRALLNGSKRLGRQAPEARARNMALHKNRACRAAALACYDEED